MVTKNGLPPGGEKKKSNMETEDHTKRKNEHGNWEYVMAGKKADIQRQTTKGEKES